MDEYLISYHCDKIIGWADSKSVGSGDNQLLNKSSWQQLYFFMIINFVIAVNNLSMATYHFSLVTSFHQDKHMR